MGAGEPTIRAVVFRQGSRWVAQCLEVNLAISAERPEDLPKRVRNQLRTQIGLDRRRGRQPFSTLRPAPARFFDMWEKSEHWKTVSLESRLQDLLRSILHASRKGIVRLAGPPALVHQPV